MLSYILRRLLYTVPLLALISVVSFVVIKLPPVDFVDITIQQLLNHGDMAAQEQVGQLRERYGLDQPGWQQYLTWVTHAARGDFGVSFQYQRPVSEVIAERLMLTVILTLATLVFTYAVAIPIGVYSATHQYSPGDYVLSFIGFVGMSIPPFMLALIVMFLAVIHGNQSVGGLFSPAFIDEPWSPSKVLDLLGHLWIPVVIIGSAGTASLIRIVRANMLDVLGQQFVTTARAKGLREELVVYKHALRVAINPLISILGLTLPRIIEGEGLAAIVMNLPTTGPVYLGALQTLDMYLAGTFLMFLAVFLVLGNLAADVLLAVVDPRIRYE